MEMFPTSTLEVRFPRGADFVFMFPYHSECRGQLFLRETFIASQTDIWIEPELRFPSRMSYVNVNSCFFSRKEEEAIAPLSEHGRRHMANDM
jgi:hypothetical protein